MSRIGSQKAQLRREQMRFDAHPDLLLRLAGPLRLIRRDRTDITPRAAKGRAVLALLGGAPALRRSRAWIQDKLWSDRSPEQGSASLRQTLHRLREAVGGDPSWLVAEAGWVALNPARVAVVVDPAPEDWEPTGEAPEFCEGLNIADPEFEDWIRNYRMAYEDRFSEAGIPTVRPPHVEMSRGLRSSAAPAFILVLMPQAAESVPSIFPVLMNIQNALSGARLACDPNKLARAEGQKARLGALSAIREAVVPIRVDEQFLPVAESAV
jgi:hypothetical protein